MQKSDSDLDEFDDDMSYEEVNDDSEVEEEEEEENGEDGGTDEEEEDGEDEGSDEEGEEDGEDEGSDEEEEENGREEKSEWKNDEMEELEEELRELQQKEQELNTLKNLKHHKDEDFLKGQAVKSQKALWYKILELRFLLQKPFSSSNRLPQESIKASFCESDETVRVAYADLITSSKETLDSILELQEALIAKNPSVTQTINGSERSSKDLEVSNDLDDNLDKEWSQISRMHNSMAAFRDKSINKWQRMTQVTTGAAAIKGKLHAFNQDISHQVAAYMRDPSRMIRQMQLRRSAVKILGSAAEVNNSSNEE
ncbi:protein AATF-like, partial [Trifolium pratense]